MNTWMNNVMPFQLQRIHDFRSQFSTELTPEQNKHLDKIANKLEHMDLHGFDELKSEGDALFGTEPATKATREAVPFPRVLAGQNYNHVMTQIRAMVLWFQ
ncbi:hypothetical protein PRK78_003415 [Emydomyces testavorans]|uniref:Uncharacterized protein n=1 Tax=Emydomyces testavorans TaxID=2070801 RepID=A0AAF0DGR5_9EURO|nr:hypothetical protein PRK78_003415 [Emydomyces testavorans]